MNIFKAFTSCISRYADFRGRSRRAEYWGFYLTTSLLTILCIVLDMMLGLNPDDAEPGEGGLVTVLFSLFIFIPSYSLLVRRLHDSGRSGWWFFITFIPPFLGGFVVLYWLFKDSEPGRNKWGENPKGDGTSAPNAEEAVSM